MADDDSPEPTPDGSPSQQQARTRNYGAAAALNDNQPSELRSGDEMIGPHKALMSLLKSMVGPGCLSLPFGWKLAGLWMSLGLSIGISFLNLFCSLQLIHTAQHLCKVSKRDALDYGHFAKKVFDHGPSERLKKHSKTMMYVANAANIFYQLGVCAIQVVFMAVNLKAVIENFTDASKQLDMRVYATMVLVPVILVNLIRELRVISILAAAANVVLLAGLVIVLQCCIRQTAQVHRLPAATNFLDTMLFVGTAMYTFEGQAAMLPLENKLRNPMEMTQRCGVLPAAMGIVSAIFIAIGFFGYVAYGNDVQGTITLNMPKTPFYNIVNLALVTAAFIGHVVNLYVIIAMLWPGIKRKAGRRFSTFPLYEVHFEILFRVATVLLTYAFAVLVPRIELMIPLIGITAGILVAFIFPPIFELLTFWNIWPRDFTFYRKVVVNITIVIFGFFIMSFGAYQNVVKIYTVIYSSA